MFHALGNRQRFDSFVRLCFSLLPQRYPPVRRAQQHPSTCSPARLAAIQQGVDSRPRMAFPGVPLDFSRCSLPGRDKWHHCVHVTHCNVTEWQENLHTGRVCVMIRSIGYNENFNRRHEARAKTVGGIKKTLIVNFHLCVIIEDNKFSIWILCVTIVNLAPSVRLSNIPIN